MAISSVVRPVVITPKDLSGSLAFAGYPIDETAPAVLGQFPALTATEMAAALFAVYHGLAADGLRTALRACQYDAAAIDAAVWSIFPPQSPIIAAMSYEPTAVVVRANGVNSADTYEIRLGDANASPLMPPDPFVATAKSDPALGGDLEARFSGSFSDQQIVTASMRRVSLPSVIPHPTVDIVAAGICPAWIPPGSTAVWFDPNGPRSFTCPVLRLNGYTYWGFSYNDNRMSLTLVAYDGQGVAFNQWDRGGLRYLWKIEIDDAAQTVTFWGQANNTTSMKWAELLLPTPVTPWSVPGTGNSAADRLRITILPAPQGLSVTSDSNSVSVAWVPVPRAEGYDVVVLGSDDRPLSSQPPVTFPQPTTARFSLSSFAKATSYRFVARARVARNLGAPSAPAAFQSPV